jgi:hypothetical protein
MFDNNANSKDDYIKIEILTTQTPFSFESGN